jgi:hypothetical protein
MNKRTGHQRLLFAHQNSLKIKQESLFQNSVGFGTASGGKYVIFFLIFAFFALN